MSRWSRTVAMSMALCRTSVLLLAGHTSTHTPQPVQSSGATWIVSQWPGRSLDRNSLLRNSAGACSTASGGKTFIRMAACGHTIVHLPQSMQMSGSQIGSSLAIDRFSYRAVPLGNVPSTGSALTGRRSPSPLMSSAVTRCTKSGASSGTLGATTVAPATLVGTVTRTSRSSAWSIARKLRSTIVWPRPP